MTDDQLSPGRGDEGAGTAQASKPRARDLNELIRYTMWSVFRVADRGTLEAAGPGKVADEVPRAYVSVYPFVRSYQWYLLDPAERRRLLAEHGMMAREYPDVRANTVACFSLNDYEWILAFEADELHRIVDLMRHLRGAEARLHTRVEIPFYTGRRKPVGELLASLA